MTEVSAPPQPIPAAMEASMRPSPPRTTKKVVIRRKKVTEPVEEQQPSGGGSPAALQMPPVRAAADGPADKRVLRRREKGRLRGCDVLGDMGEFEAELTAVLPPPPKPSPPPNKDTYNLDSLPPDVREAVLIAPDGGTALLAVYEALKAEKEAMAVRMTTLAMTRTGETRTPDMENVFGTRTMSNRYPLSHPSGEVLEASKTRVLRQWEKQQRVWGAQEAKLAAETDKPPQALAMSERRMQEARKRRELVDKYLMAMPMDQRMGEVQWYMSLRDGWTRYVQAGNLFSGLFTAVREKPVHLNRDSVSTIRKVDLDRPGSPPATLSSRAKLETLRDRSLSARGRAWADGDYLRYRTQLYAKNIKDLVGHEPECESLVVKGEGMDSTLWEKANGEINLELVETRLRAQDPEAFEALQEAKAAEERRVWEEEEERRNALMAMAVADNLQPKEGPSMMVSDSRLVLVADAGEVGRSALQVENNGSTALYYTWSGAMRKLQPNAKGGGAYDTERFYLSDQSGVLLPGQSKIFIFTFKSDQPGIFEAAWSIDTHPKLEKPADPVVLRGISTSWDTKRLQRRLCQADMTMREKKQQVSVAMERVIREVHTPQRTAAPLTEEQRAQEALFSAKNTVQQGPAVYYSPESFAEMEALYKSAHLVLHPALTEEELAAREKEKSRSKEQGEVRPYASAEWSGSVADLRGIVEEARKAATQAAADSEEAEDADDSRRAASQLQARAEEMKSKLDFLLDAVKVPSSRKDIASTVLRQVAWKMANAVADLAGEAMEEAQAREQERQEEEPRDAVAAGVKPKAPATKGKDEPPPYDADEFMEILEGYSMPETTNAARRFGKMIRQKDAEIAAHIDAKIEAISLAQEGEPEGLAWKKFSLLRTRKGLRLPGGVEIRQQVGDEAEEESEDEVEEGNGEEAGEEDELNQEINASRN